MVRKWAIIVLWGAVELFSDKHQRSNVLLCRGAGTYGDMGTDPHKFWQIVHTLLNEFQSKEADYAHQLGLSPSFENRRRPVVPY